MPRPSPTRGDGGKEPGLGIGQVAARGGVSEGALRTWEARHGFPKPRRLRSGHRRYSELDAQQVRAVVQARAGGLSLTAAIERARRLGTEPRPSVYAALRQQSPDLQAHLLSKRALIALSHAIEDEACVRAERPLLFGCFQHERAYRAAEPRWRELSRTADRSLVFADFPEARRPRGGPLEVRIASEDPLTREWVIVCDAPNHGACLAAAERPAAPGHGQRFETVWTVDPTAVREAARVCGELAARSDPELGARLRERLAQAPRSGPGDVRSTVELATRMVLYATGEGR